MNCPYYVREKSQFLTPKKLSPITGKQHSTIFKNFPIPPITNGFNGIFQNPFLCCKKVSCCLTCFEIFPFLKHIGQQQQHGFDYVKP